MKAIELMLGDWVLTTKEDHMNEFAQIDAIEEGQTCILLRQDNTNFFTDISKIEPIPITKEILEKNGFKVREGCTTAWDWYNGEQCVHISGDHTCPIGQTLTIYVSAGCVGAAFSSYRVLNELKVRGLHEFQHALRLCRIEKQIIL